ncbi:ASN_collapsed_G0031640.mRNA.1.CDS.1 [Saccharomyces cerevisiae]|nr:ASN_collapsed_G0031640.mRNA.1.CDS.1 [Saccharomyces cerevisiae]
MMRSRKAAWRKLEGDEEVLEAIAPYFPETMLANNTFATWSPVRSQMLAFGPSETMVLLNESFREGIYG